MSADAGAVAVAATGEGLELDRHELLWVFEQCGVDAWPYPLRPVHWAAETVEETVIHRGRTEQRLRGRGLLEPGPARALLGAGELAASWTLAADLVHRGEGAPWAAVALCDGTRAWLLASADHAHAPVRMRTCDPRGLPEALLALVGPGRPGRDGPWPVHPSAPAPGVPSTRRGDAARGAAAELLSGATGFGQVGAAARRPGAGPVFRSPRLVGWIDGPRGRYRLRPPPGTGRPAALDPVNDTRLAVDVRTVLTEARQGVATAAREPAVVPRDGPPGRSTT